MNTLGRLDDATVAAALGVYELDFDLDRKAALWTGLAKVRAALGAADPDPGVPPHVWAAVRNRARGRCELCGHRKTPLQREHVLSRLALRKVLGFTWEAVHAPAVIAAACGRCNVDKGTISLGPDDLQWLWRYHGFSITAADRDLYLFAATVIEAKSWTGLPIRQEVEADLRTLHPAKPALGALMRQRGLHTQADDLDSTIAAVWADELASDDNRELWGRASWQREPYPAPTRDARERCARAWRSA